MMQFEKCMRYCTDWFWPSRSVNNVWVALFRIINCRALSHEKTDDDYNVC